MSGRNALPKNIVYLYDGTFDGLLCCVFESVAQKEMPADILPETAEQLPLTPVKQIETDRQKAVRVYRSIVPKMSATALEFIENAFLTCHPRKEWLIVDFFHQGYRYGPRVLNRLADDTVDALSKAVLHATHEAHLLTGFIRFSIINRILVSTIGPKNFVLPLIRAHFTDRFPNEAFMIYDETHGMALVHRPGQAAIIPMDDFVMNDPDEEELQFRALWKLFYDTIAVQGRENPKCRMSLMPKRYWQYMTEFQTGSARNHDMLGNTEENRLPSAEG